MKDPISKLLSICSNGIAKPFDDDFDLFPFGFLSDFTEYISVLRKCNGFYGFESALHVFPLKSKNNSLDVLKWNDNKLWRDSYDGMTEDHFFFAEDAFGGQFSIKKDGVFTFDPETGEGQKLCDSLSQWCEAILNDYDFLTGHSLMHEWQARNGRVKEGHRLIPVIPFVLGGDFSVKNLRMQHSVTAMRYRGNIAVQIRNLPDGGTIKLDVDNSNPV